MGEWEGGCLLISNVFLDQLGKTNDQQSCTIILLCSFEELSGNDLYIIMMVTGQDMVCGHMDEAHKPSTI